MTVLVSVWLVTVLVSVWLVTVLVSVWLVTVLVSVCDVVGCIVPQGLSGASKLTLKSTHLA